TMAPAPAAGPKPTNAIPPGITPASVARAPAEADKPAVAEPGPMPAGAASPVVLPQPRPAGPPAIGSPATAREDAEAKARRFG
ncbi:hypothetical protein FV230_07455, partial [Methylobacterium sp. WL6]